jgi:hypothetical protein
LTFYQAGFENNDRTTVLQVVRNPSWALPYVACALMTLGLLFQFSLHLAKFVARRRSVPVAIRGSAAAATATSAPSAALPRPLHSKPSVAARATS